MDRKTTIEYMREYIRKELACDKTPWETCFNYDTCADCPNSFSVPLSEVVEAALKLLEAEEEDAEV